MGHYVTEVFDPEMLDIPNDTDFYEEGIDEAWQSYLEYEAYLPDRIGDLPKLSPEAIVACEHAQAEIDAVAALELPNVVTGPVAELLLYDEAVSTTQVEHYQTTCSSMLDANATRSVAGYLPQNERVALDAVDALRDFQAQGPRLTLGDICTINEVFTRNSDRAEWCGTLRERPVWIGGTTIAEASYVAPPADYIEEYLAELIDYVNADTPDVNPIAKAAIAHMQFVNVHPFEDGNGRCGRALATWVLDREGATRGLSLPFTSYIAAKRPDYLRAIASTQREGASDPSTFVTFFAECCENAAVQARILSQQTERLLDDWTRRAHTHDVGIRAAIASFATNPVMSEAMLRGAGIKNPTSALDTLAAAGIVHRQKSSFANVDVYVATEALANLEGAQQMRGVPLHVNRQVLQAFGKVTEPLATPVATKSDSTDSAPFSF